MLKAACEACGYTVRVARKWAELGAPICPADDHGLMTVHGLDEEPADDGEGAALPEAA